MGLTGVESSAHFVRPSFDHRRMNLWYTLLLLIHDLVGGLWLGSLGVIGEARTSAGGKGTRQRPGARWAGRTR